MYIIYWEMRVLSSLMELQRFDVFLDLVEMGSTALDGSPCLAGFQQYV